MAQLIWSPAASDNLEEIRAYVAQTSESTARSILREVLELAEQIRQNPLHGSIVPEYGRSEIRERLCRSFRVVYRFAASDIVEIVVIHRASRPLPRRLPR